jgi:general secretion pathway protein G
MYRKRARLPATRPPRCGRGVTLLELMVVVAIATILFAASIPAYRGYRERMAIDTAVADIARIRLAIERFRAASEGVPDDLAAVGMDDLQDPWGRPYQYLSFSSGEPGWRGRRRKDRNLVPINSDFDLYSLGADGRSQPPITSRASQDDIIMASDGAYVGLAKDY